jgi:FIST-like protein
MPSGILRPIVNRRGAAQKRPPSIQWTSAGRRRGAWDEAPLPRLAVRGGGSGVHLLICDPFTFPAGDLLAHLNERVPGTVVIGGMASEGWCCVSRLFIGGRVLSHGAVGAGITAMPASLARLGVAWAWSGRHPHNLYVTNVPGPPVPLYLAGACSKRPRRTLVAGVRLSGASSRLCCFMVGRVSLAIT